MRNTLSLGLLVSLGCLWGSGAMAQSGAINKAVGGYSFEDAAKESPATKKDGKPLTFAIITHTAGNGFFDPVYVGAQVAANAFGINLIMPRVGIGGRRHSARNPDPQPDRQRPHHQRRDHDDAAGGRLQRYREEARGEGRRRRHDQFL